MQYKVIYINTDALGFMSNGMQELEKMLNDGWVIYNATGSAKAIIYTLQKC